MPTAYAADTTANDAFKIDRQIGYGAQAEVFQITSTGFSAESLALKVFDDETTYQREINIFAYLRRMAQRNSFEPAFIVVPSFYGEINFENSKQLRFAMAMPIHGRTLTGRLHEILSLKKNQLTHQQYQEEVFKLFFCLVGMLDTLQKAGIYDPDLSPKNILESYKANTEEIDEARPWVVVDLACAKPYKTVESGERLAGPMLYHAPELQEAGAARISSPFAAMVWAMSQILAQVLGVSFAYKRKGWLPNADITHSQEYRIPTMTADMLQQKLEAGFSGDFYTFMLSVMSAMENDAFSKRPGIVLLHRAVAAAMQLKDVVSPKLEPETVVLDDNDNSQNTGTTTTALSCVSSAHLFSIVRKNHKEGGDPPPLPRWEPICVSQDLSTPILGKNSVISLEGMRLF